MAQVTAVVGSVLRDQLYERALRGEMDLYILDEEIWNEAGTLHYLTILSDHETARRHHKSHVDVVLDANGLRYKLDCDV